MTQSTMIPETTIGIDLGDKKSHICVLSADGEVQERAEVPTTMAAMRRRFELCKPLRIAIEAGGQSGWISELLKELGHEVIIDQKSDAVDAEQLARVGRLDVPNPISVPLAAIGTALLAVIAGLAASAKPLGASPIDTLRA